MDKTVEELREGITKELYALLYTSKCSSWTPEVSCYGRDCTICLADQILSFEPLPTLLKLLDQTRDDCGWCDGKGMYEDLSAGQEGILIFECSKCQGTGKVGEWHPERLVVLDKDQSLPEPHMHPVEGVLIRFIQDLKEAGFRKVKEG